MAYTRKGAGRQAEVGNIFLFMSVSSCSQSSTVMIS